jgi:CubicO group peptidase (beta-lactamase class C family)
MRIFFSIILAFFALSFYSQNSFINDSLDLYVQREMKKWQIPGVAVSVVKDGKIIVCKGFGTTELNGKNKVDEQTLFQIASNSKAFTGTALAMLDVSKKISLDDKVKKWIPYFDLKDQYAANEATVKDMLCHRIGFQTFQSDFLNWNCNLSRTELIKAMKTVSPVNPFRYKYGYCNSAFLVAGEVIKAATDTSWDDFIQHRFLNPLNMTRSSTRHEKIATDKNAAKPYTILNDKMELLEYANIDNIGPAASMNSCVKDLSNWLLCQLDSGRFNGKQVIPYKAISLTRTPNMISGRGGNPNYPGNHFSLYGLGWGIKDVDGKVMYEHTGGADGFVTSVCVIPEFNLGIVVLTNTDVNTLFLALREQIIQSYLNKPYQNLSENYFMSNLEENKQQVDEIRQWKKVAEENKSKFELSSQLVGKYYNEVYGEIEIKNVGAEQIIYFSKHTDAKGKLSYMGNNLMLCEYSYKTWGIQKLKIYNIAKEIKSITIKVNDFVDYLDYEFVKIK